MLEERNLQNLNTLSFCLHFRNNKVLDTVNINEHANINNQIKYLHVCIIILSY